jgi:hypothetical protein
MKGASRQLCIERITIENDARRLCGMEPLSAREEDFYREKVKVELRTEFERRVVLQDKIDKEKKGFDLIFEELDKGDVLDKNHIWWRGFGGREETLQSRMGRMEHLIQRIYGDLGIKTVYSGPQNTKDLNGSISAAAMSDMVRVYFAANTQAEGEKALQEYYKKSFNLPKTDESDETSAEQDASLVHGVVPTKVTAHGIFTNISGKWSYSIEFWNVGKLGGEPFAKATYTNVNIEPVEGYEGQIQNEPDRYAPSAGVGYFTGGPNGDIYVTIVTSTGYSYDSHYKVKDGKAVIFSNGVSTPIGNPEAFNGWVD